jgi:4-alpha-glucanotransferase
MVERALVSPESSDDVDELVVGLHRLLAQSPSRLRGVALVDLVGDTVPQNQPGTDQEHPNWRIPLCDADGRAVLVDDLRSDPDLARRAARLIATVNGKSSPPLAPLRREDDGARG